MLLYPSARRRSSAAKLPRLIAVIVLVVMSGCQGGTPAERQSTVHTPSPTAAASTTAPTLVPFSPNPSSIIGKWQLSNGYTITFDSAGRMQVVDLGGGVVDHGTYLFDGVALVMDSAADSVVCSGETGEYEVSFSRGGDRANLSLTSDDPCADRRGTITHGMSRLPD